MKLANHSFLSIFFRRMFLKLLAWFAVKTGFYSFSYRAVVANCLDYLAYISIVLDCVSLKDKNLFLLPILELL